MRLNGRSIGIEHEMHFSNCVIPGLTDDWRDGRVWETVHDFIDGGSHGGVSQVKLKVVRTDKHITIDAK